MNEISFTVYWPSIEDLATVMPWKPSTEPVKRKVKGTALVPPGSSLKTLSPQPSVSCASDDQELELQSELVAAGCTRQKALLEQTGVRSRFDNPYIDWSLSRVAAIEKFFHILLKSEPICPEGTPIGFRPRFSTPLDPVDVSAARLRIAAPPPR